MVKKGVRFKIQFSLTQLITFTFFLKGRYCIYGAFKMDPSSHKGTNPKDNILSKLNVKLLTIIKNLVDIFKTL